MSCLAFRILEMSRLIELGLKLTKRNLLEMTANKNDVEAIINAPVSVAMVFAILISCCGSFFRGVGLEVVMVR